MTNLSASSINFNRNHVKCSPPLHLIPGANVIAFPAGSFTVTDVSDFFAVARASVWPPATAGCNDNCFPVVSATLPL